MAQIELVFIPSSGMGHLVPTVELAKRIVQTNRNISIYFIIYYMSNDSKNVLAYFDYLSRDAVLNRITFITLPRLSNPPDPSSPLFFPTVINLQKPLIKTTISDHQLKPAAIVVDLVNISMADVAKELDIPFYIFFTSGPAYLNTLFQSQAFADEQGIDEFTKLVSNPDNELDLIGFRNPVPTKVLPGPLLDLTWAMIDLAKAFREAKGILINSFTELEPLTIKALERQDNIPTVYPVGPILTLDQYVDNVENEDTIISWLDKQPISSVVFLCFGSAGRLNVEQVIKIVNGLDRSGHRFLLTIRLPGDNETITNVLPEGLLHRTALKGKIVSWAPQVKVLAHEAVGGFVSHCGWNSILQSIWFGVPIATWPLFAEQQLNAFMLVEELELAVKISLHYRWKSNTKVGSYLISSDEVEKAVNILMNMDKEAKERVNLREMSRSSRNALQADIGSSYKCLAKFIEGVTENVKLD